MVELQEQLGAFEKKGLRIAGLSPDEPEKLAELARKSKLTFPLLSDADGKTLSAWGLRNPEIDARPIPHPTAIVVDAKGTIRYLRIDRDFRERPAPGELLGALDDPGIKSKEKN